MNKRIVIISEDYPPDRGGVAQWACGIAQGFHDSGCGVHVYCRSIAGEASRTSAFPVTCLVRPRRVWKHGRTWVWRSAIRKHIAQHGPPDLIITSKWAASRGVLCAAESLGIPVFTAVHGLEITRDMPGLKKRWLVRTLNRSAKTLSVSAYTARYTREVLGVDHEKVVVVPNGVDPAAFNLLLDVRSLRSELGIENARVVLTLSRVIERKGHDMIIRSLPRIHQAIPEAVYVIAGEGHEKEIARLKKIAAELNVLDSVLFTGAVSPEMLNAFYHMCDVYAMPSRVLSNGDCEGFGITFLEANACGKPVVGGRSGGIPDAIIDGETGFLVEPEDSDAIADRIIFLLSNPEAAQRLGRNGRARIESTHNWTSISASILSLLSPA